GLDHVVSDSGHADGEPQLRAGALRAERERLVEGAPRDGAPRQREAEDVAERGDAGHLPGLPKDGRPGDIVGLRDQLTAPEQVRELAGRGHELPALYGVPELVPVVEEEGRRAALRGSLGR